MKTLVMFLTAAVVTLTLVQAQASDLAPKNLYQVVAPLETIHTVLDPAAIDIWNLDVSKQDPTLVEAQIYTTQQEIDKLAKAQDTLLDDATSSATPLITLVKDSAAIESAVSEDQQARQACLARTSKNFTASALKQLDHVLDSDFFQCFRPFHQIIEFLDALTQVFPTGGANVLTRLPTIGKTYEGVAIPAYKLSTSTSALSTETTKRALYIQSLIHAREFIAGSSLMVTIATLLDQLRDGSNPDLHALFNQFDLFFVPVVNIDGYNYAWTSNGRMWRKNRRTKSTGTGNKPMYGVDLNRNWGPKEIFNLDHNTNLRDDTYPGEFMYSEPETQALNGFLTSLGRNLAGLMDIHSFSGVVLFPFGYQQDPMPSPFGDKIAQVADQVRQVIGNNGASQQYDAKQIYDLYNAPSYGSMLDSIVVQYGNNVAGLGLEVEGNSFLEDQQSILPIGKSIAAGIVQFFKEVSKYNE